MNLIADAPRLQSSSNANPSSHLSRSVTVAGDRSPSSKIRSTDQTNPLNDEETDSTTTDKNDKQKLRTFLGWKRDTTHFDRSRLAKGLMRSQVKSLLAG